MKKKSQGLLSQRINNELPHNDIKSNNNSGSSFVAPNTEIIIDYDDGQPPKQTKNKQGNTNIPVTKNNSKKTKNKKGNSKKNHSSSSNISNTPTISNTKQKLKNIANNNGDFGNNQQTFRYSNFENKKNDDEDLKNIDIETLSMEIKREREKERKQKNDIYEVIKEKIPAKIVLKRIFTKKHILIGILVCFILFVAIEQIPSLVYKIVPDENKSSGSIELTIEENSQNTTKNVLDAYSQEDFDDDKIINEKDESPYDPDSDKNGIIDGDLTSTPIKTTTKVSNDDVEITVSNNLSGIKKFNDTYIFTSYKGWAKINKGEGYPYIYINNKWKLADFQKGEDCLLVYIPGDCRLEILSSQATPVTVINLFGGRFAYANGKNPTVTNVGFAKYIFDAFFSVILPQYSDLNWGIGSIQQTTDYHYNKYMKDITAPAVIGTYDLSTADRYTSYDNSLSVIENIMTMIDNDHTVICSLQGDNGECIGIVYGYDYLGNLYIADYRTGELVGSININPKSQIITSGDEVMIRDWYEFNGLGYNSAKGDRAVFIFSE